MAGSPDSSGDSNIGRRSFLQTAGGVAAMAALGPGDASETTSAGRYSMTNMPESGDGSDSTDGSFQVGNDLLAIGGRHVVGEDAYPTIEAAWKAANSGDTVYVHSSYDAKSVGEQFPVRLDFREKEVMLTGGHPSGSVIDASHTDENVVEVYGAGPSDYQNNPVVRNLQIVGGNVGLKIFGAPFSSYENLVFHETGSHGVEVCKYDVDGTSYGTFGTTFSDCQAWGCGEDGFHLNTDAAPHGTTFFCCKATACGGNGFRLRGANVKIVSGGTQLNYGWGIVARGGFNNFVQGVYIEGNARGSDISMPTEVYVRNADGITFENCYFHGIYPRGAEHDFDRVQRGITAHDTECLTTQSCTARRYGEGYLAFFGCSDAEVHCASHVVRETQLFGGGTGTRARSNGVILPQDLSSVDGAYEGDRGYHVGSESEGMAVWRNGQWHVSETTSL